MSRTFAAMIQFDEFVQVDDQRRGETTASGSSSALEEFADSIL